MVAGAEGLLLLFGKDGKEVGCKYLEGYGLTEASPVLSFSVPGDGSGELRWPLAAGVEVKSCIQRPKTICRAEKSASFVFADGVFSGYLNQPSETSEVLMKDGWLVTGDLGRIDTDGFLFIEGRLSRFSKIGGDGASWNRGRGRSESTRRSEDDDPFCAVVGTEDDAKESV